MNLEKRQRIVAEIRRLVLEEFLHFEPAQELKIGDAVFLSNRVGTILFELLPEGGDDGS